MDFRKEILKEHSKIQCEKIVNYVGNYASRFNELVEVFLVGPYRVTQRIAWPMSRCVEEHPQLISPHLNQILKQVQRADAHDSVKRNVMRLLQHIHIPTKLRGKVAAICFQFFTDKKEPIAVRVFAMTVLANLAKELPELKNELIPLIEDEMPYASAGFISRGRKILKELSKAKSQTPSDN